MLSFNIQYICFTLEESSVREFDTAGINRWGGGGGGAGL